MQKTRLRSFARSTAAAAMALLVSFADARNVRLMESVPDAARAGHVHEILGNLELRFGGDTANGVRIVRRDVVVTGTGATTLNDVGDGDRVRPTDHDLCARAFEDAITQLAFAARGVHATAILGVVSNYEGRLFDDPAHFECHAGAIKAVVTLRAQLAADVPAPAVVPPPTIVPPPPPTVPVPPPVQIVPPASSPTFQPLPPLPAPAPN